MDLSKLKTLTRKEVSDVLEYTYDIIDNLPDKALNELLGGDDKGTDQLIGDIMSAISDVFNLDNYTMKEFGGLHNFEREFDEGMKRLSYNYFKTTMLPNFSQGWRNLEWGNLFQIYPWSSYLASRGSGKSYEACYAFPLWRMYRYQRPSFAKKDNRDNRNSKETIIITNESRLAKLHMEKIANEIKTNELLREKLLPDKSSDVGVEKIAVKNGATVAYRTFGSFIRGLHVGTVMVDDFLDESCLYSKDQRDKYHEIFYGSIKSIVEPGGYLIVTGTPYHEEDLYQELKQDPMFRVFEYPAIFPDGSILAPDRHSFEYLMNLQRSLGSIVFSREYLVAPVSDSSSLFPWEFLRRSFIGMENVKLVEDIDNYPIKFDKVVMGCDFAISGNIGADYSVFSVWGRAQNNYYLIGIWRKQGASHREQVDVIDRMNNTYKPHTIVAESNGFQVIMSDLVRERGVRNIKEFKTTAKVKKNSYEGLPSLSAMFERGEIKIPYAQGESKESADWLCGEFNSITFLEDSGKLESSGAHDDGVMSSFFAITELREKKKGFKVSYM